LFHLSQESPSFVAKVTQASINLSLGKFQAAVDVLNEAQTNASGSEIPQLHYLRARAHFLAGNI